VILVDANILIYAYDKSAPQYSAAQKWLDGQLSGSARVGLPWPSLLAFLRIVTNPRAVKSVISIDIAWSQVVDWLGCDPAWIPQPTERHAEILGELLLQSKAYGNLMSDAHIAALAIEHGLTLCSADSDFSKFSRLRWLNPLE
jgi:toxin-antitoxin system PIN domain toxin